MHKNFFKCHPPDIGVTKILLYMASPGHCCAKQILICHIPTIVVHSNFIICHDSDTGVHQENLYVIPRPSVCTKNFFISWHARSLVCTISFYIILSTIGVIKLLYMPCPYHCCTLKSLYAMPLTLMSTMTSLYTMTGTSMCKKLLLKTLCQHQTRVHFL